MLSYRGLIWGLCAALILSGCTSTPNQGPRESSYALSSTNKSAIARSIAPRKAAHPELSGFQLLTDGLDAFVARAVLAERADHSIDAQYYLYHGDRVGKLLTSLLIDAADRGVRVRLLVDDMALDNGDTGAIALDAHLNIEVRIFNPFFRNAPRAAQFVARFGSVTRRMHNKSFTVDNQITVVGGRNIGDEYFDADASLIFGDLDVVAIGPVVEDVSASFDLYWNHRLAYPIESLALSSPTESLIEKARENLAFFRADQADSDYLNALRNSDLSKALRHDGLEYHWGQGTVVFDDPDKITSSRQRKDLHLVTQLQKHTSEIEKDLIIYSPYFVPGKKGVAWLAGLRDRGVRVRILTNSLASTDVSVVHAGYARYRKALLRAGVELWEFDNKLTREQRKSMKGTSGSSKASLHSKSFVIDNKKVFIGSLNIDPRSIVENTEIGIVIESAELAAQMTDLFENDIVDLAFRLELTKGKYGGDKLIWHGLEDGVSQIYTNEPNAGFWRRLGVIFLRWLPIESQL